MGPVSLGDILSFSIPGHAGGRAALTAMTNEGEAARGAAGDDAGGRRAAARRLHHGDAHPAARVKLGAAQAGRRAADAEQDRGPCIKKINWKANLISLMFSIYFT